MTRYRKYVESLCKANSDEVFFNSSIEHAKIVLIELLRSAKEEVFIVSRNLSIDITNDEEYLKALEGFLKRVSEKNSPNKPLQIILTKYDEETFKRSRVCQKLEEYSQQVALHEGNEQLFQNDNETLVNFVVVDRKAYRFEYDIENRAAVCSFFQKEDAEALARAFIDGKKHSSSILFPFSSQNAQ